MSRAGLGVQVPAGSIVTLWASSALSPARFNDLISIDKIAGVQAKVSAVLGVMQESTRAAMACSRCERHFSSAGLWLAGSCVTCPDGESLCQNCVNRHASDARFAGHQCRTLEDRAVYAGADILARLGLFPAPKACPRHSQPFLDVHCVACRADADAALHRFCASCVNEHAHEQPTHVLAPFAPNIIAMRTKLRALVATPAASCVEPSDIGGTCTSASAPSSIDSSTSGPALIETAHRRALAARAELETLVEHEEAAVAQLEANRDAVMAALQACAGVCIDAVHRVAAAKQCALEAELKAADAALENAVFTTEALTEVRTNQHPATSAFTHHNPCGSPLPHFALLLLALCRPLKCLMTLIYWNTLSRSLRDLQSSVRR